MKVGVVLDEKKIINKYLIFQSSSGNGRLELPYEKMEPIFSNSSSGSSFTLSPSVFSTPTLDFELPKIDTSGC